MKYRRLRRMDPFWAAMQLKRQIPELESYDTDHLQHYLMGSKLVFFEEVKKPVPKLIRLTLPFALLLMLLMTISLPVNFMVTGSWGYGNNKIHNWFKMLGF